MLSSLRTCLSNLCTACKHTRHDKLYVQISFFNFQAWLEKWSK